MKKRMIGNLEVSEIGMGCMGFSHGYGKVPEEGYALDAIRKAYETGCTFFDTAEVYGDIMFYPGHNELLVGKAISGFRKDVVLATKLFIYSEELSGGKSIREAVRAHLEKSLANLIRTISTFITCTVSMRKFPSKKWPKPWEVSSGRESYVHGGCRR